MKKLFIVLTLLTFNTLLSQSLITHKWNIDHLFDQYPEVSDVYFLKKADTTNTSNFLLSFTPEGTFKTATASGTYQLVGKHYIYIQIPPIGNFGSYYIHYPSDKEAYLIKSTGNANLDKQKLKEIIALERFYQLHSKSPNPSFLLKSDVPKDERIGKLIRKLFHLTNYQILKAFPTETYTYYLVKDLETNTDYYLQEEYFKDKVTVYYFTEKDIKKLTKANKKKQR
nr:hypothetical protein [uncultured Capnocytophaga sp.]